MLTSTRGLILGVALAVAAQPAFAKKKSKSESKAKKHSQEPKDDDARPEPKKAEAKRAEAKKPEAKKEPRVVAADVIARYRQAIGGPAFQDLQSRRVTGTVESVPVKGAAEKGQLELVWKAPGKAREVWTLADGRLKRVFDGQKGWVQGPAIKKRQLHAAERAELSRLAALYQPALILPLEDLSVERNETKDGRTLNVLKSKNGDFAWFDALTGLPVRLDLLEERPEPERAGEFGLTQVYFDEWSFVGATQVPHKLRRVRPEGETTYALVDVQQNTETPDKLFKKPMWWRR